MGFTENLERDRAVLGRLLDQLDLPANLISPIQAHARAVRDSADRLGLISPNDVEAVVVRHSADSLLFALARRPTAGESWVDVGSGAGFPGVVLACCFPECAFALLEPLKRRAGFLELVGADLGLSNLEVVPRRLEDLESDTFDVAVARAFAEPMLALRSMLRILKPGGRAYVSVSPGVRIEAGATLVRIDDAGDVDSPGLFSMMTREG